MTVGTGIFLSAIFIGFIALFVATKDRWKWKKIVLWFGGIVGLFVIGFFGLLAYENRPDPPEKLAEFWNIPLDMSQDEVLFRKGKPSFIVDEGPNAEWLFTYDKGYANYSFEVLFKDNKVRTVFYRGPSYESPNVGGVDIGNSQEQLIKAFGQPSSISNSNDSLRRFVHFSKYNLFAGLEMNQVIGFGIYNPAYGDLEFAKDAEKRPWDDDPVIVPANDLP